MIKKPSQHNGTWYYDTEIESKVWGPLQWGVAIDWQSGGNFGERLLFLTVGRLTFRWVLGEVER